MTFTPLVLSFSLSLHSCFLLSTSFFTLSSYFTCCTYLFFFHSILVWNNKIHCLTLRCS
ncbi:uncharacterized protein BYT42DRAFT_513636 [Radiomyces spectabilis]|uniref:uncharacterized protein n=1 Tax=Radiomyces spectabilis TaxID=64574 RepID=UPI00221FE12B|nr:uncharacterized protein BYT42DRAFT_513636 [Radiomyces spectabilis]KAI8381315.1 hypothetical protein BYT42DRAFT_513636 [Radiomyces spectabilis]